MYSPSKFYMRHVHDRLLKQRQPYTIMPDVAFLTKDLIILPSSSIQGHGFITFEVRSLQAGLPVFRCQFPLLKRAYNPHFLKHPVSNHGPHCPTRYAKVFLPDPRVSILPILFEPIGGSPTVQFTVVLSVNRFMNRCRSILDKSVNQSVPLIPWDQWGPAVTRWLPPDILGHYGSRMVWGSRMLALLRTEIPHGIRFRTVLMDFNPRAMHRVRTSEEDDDGFTLRVTDQETVWAFSNIRVTSCLPYRAWTSTLDHRYRNLSLEANTIVGRLVSGSLIVLLHRTIDATF